MIISLGLRNFQSHKRSKLEFHKGVNIIIGSTDSGKSSIIRALRWLVSNKPLGDSFRSYWGGRTVVKAEMDGSEIVRLKSNSENGYVTHSPEGIYNAIKTEVPVEIKNILNLNEVNLHQQLDSHFLLSNTPGEVSSYFNKIANLQSIDKGTSNVKKWMTSLNSDIKYETENLKNKKEELKSYEYLDKFENEIEVLEQLEKDLNSLKNSKKNLKNIIEDIYIIEENVTIYENVLSIEGKVNEILSLKERKEKENIKLTNLTILVNSLSTAEKSIERYKKITKIETIVNETIALLSKKDEFISKKDLLRSFTINISRNKEELKTKEELYNRYETKFNKNMPNECPLCGNINTMKDER